MGYWNGYTNYEEWFAATKGTKICENCNNEFQPKSAKQKYCSREDSPECDDDRFYEDLWNKNKHPLQLTTTQNQQQ